MKQCIFAIVLLAVSTHEARAQPSLSPPAGFSKISGAVFIGVSSAPTFGIGYPLAEWSSFFRRGHGTIVGLVGKTTFGIGLGHHFTDYTTTAGEVVSFTIGPCFTLPYSGNGLRVGRLGVFATVGFHIEPKPAKENR